MLELVLVRPLLGDLSLQKLMVPHDFLELSALVQKGEVARLQFLQQRVVVVVPEYRIAYFTILLLSSRISALFSWMSFSTWRCRP